MPLGDESANRGSLPDWLDALEWLDAFLVLAVRRCQPFFAEMGVPEAMVQSPGQLVGISRTFVEAQRRIATHDPWEYRLADTTLRKDAFAQIEQAYGADATRDLHAWATRQFVDADQSDDLWIWSTLLPRLADAYGHGSPAAAAPLSAVQMERFERLVRSWFGWDIEARDDERLERASSIPLDDEEQRWLTLEVEDEDDKEERDILQHVEGTLHAERAYQVWRDLTTWLDREAQEAIVAWARQVGVEEMSGMTPDLVRLPSWKESGAA